MIPLPQPQGLEDIDPRVYKAYANAMVRLMFERPALTADQVVHDYRPIVHVGGGNEAGYVVVVDFVETERFYKERQN